MKTWKAVDITTSNYLGVYEFSDNNGGLHVFEVLQTPDYLVFGCCCNIGFLESGHMELDRAFSLDENLQEMCADLETYYSDGKEYVSGIVCSERM